MTCIPHQKKIKSYQSTEYRQWVTEKVLDSLYANALGSAMGSFAVFLIVAGAVWSKISSPPLLYWSVAGVLIAAARLVLWNCFKHKKDNYSCRFWLNSYRLLSLASGLLFGMAMWLFFGDLPVEYRLLIYFGVGGTTAASSGSHAVDLLTFQLFMFSSCLLVISKLIHFGGATDIALAAMFVLYILVMMKTGQNNNRTLLQNFKLTYTMHYRATHDPLLDLLNRTEFENRFEINTPSTHRGVAIMFLDLDNFKPLNDAFGHQAGDRALKQVADILTESLRADDPVARIGGDEFVASLYLDDVKEVEKIADNILQRINAISFPEQPGFSGLSASIGIAFHHNNDVEYSQLLHAADLACYQSKEKGKNQLTKVLAKDQPT